MEIDIEKFMNIMKSALIASAGESQPTHNRPEEQSSASLDLPKKRPRGRPKKEKSISYQSGVEIQTHFEDNVIDLTEDEDDEKEKLFEPPRNKSQRPKFGANFVANAKGQDYGNKIKAKTKAFKPPTGPNLFDVKGYGNLKKEESYNSKGEKIQYPPHTEGRPPAKQVKIRCDHCGQKFQIFMSELKPAVAEEGKPLHYCSDCERVPR